MYRRLVLPAILAILFSCLSSAFSIEPPDNFRRENLIAWCIVPFDAKERGPEERAAMLDRLGLRRVAYDWRERHVPQFEEEILAYKKHDIEMFAFWRGHPTAFPLFEQYGLKPQIWRPIPTGEGLTINEKVASAVEKLLPEVELAKTQGLAFGLYNHGGWGGLPDSMVRVCKAFHDLGHTHVGIVYNFHHAHPMIYSFPKDLKKLRPYLLCVNLNGMVNPSKYDVAKLENRIRLIGEGSLEKNMIQQLIRSGYDGPVGIIGHMETKDVEIVLRSNLEGLEKLLSEIDDASKE